MIPHTQLSIGLETEIILCNEDGKPAFMHNGEKLSAMLLKLLEQHYGTQIRKFVKPELDSCQLEIINPYPHQNIADAINEIQEKLYEVLKITTNEGLSISNEPYGQNSEGITHSDTEERYKTIHERLLRQSNEARNSTNISGTHINIQTGNNFREHIGISRYVKELLENEQFSTLEMSQIRYKKYVQTVELLQDLLDLGNNTTPLGISEKIIHEHLLDSKKNPYSSYELVRLKRLPSGIYLSEIRTCDGPVGSDPINDFGNKTDALFNRLVLPHVN